jgi:hypothetical protein
MKSSNPLPIVIGLLVLVVLQVVWTLWMTANFNAQLKASTEAHNSQLMALTEAHNAQLFELTERLNAQLMAQALAEPTRLITTLGEHALSADITLRINERGADPLSFTVARRFADGTSTESGFGPLAEPGKPFVLCWQPDRKRLWAASALVIGHVDIRDIREQDDKVAASNESNAKGSMNFTLNISPEQAAEMPAEFRAAASSWVVISDGKK